MSTDGDFADAILYRMAYGLAADLAEIRRFDHAWGRACAAGVGGDRQAIEIKVLRQLDVGQGPAAEVVREAVADALEGRRPRW